MADRRSHCVDDGGCGGEDLIAQCAEFLASALQEVVGGRSGPERAGDLESGILWLLSIGK